MSIAEFDHEDFDQTRQAEQDEKLLVKFYYKSVQDQTASREQNRAVFKECEYIDIRIPGARGTGAARRATHRDKQRFPKHYAAFKQRIEMPLEGTPLTEWPVISRAFAEELSFMGVKTVEQLANMADGNASQMMGGQSFKAKAVAWLERAKKDVTLDQMEVELAKRDTLLAEMQAQLDKLQADKPKRKRRTKEQIAHDSELSDIGERAPEQGSSGSGADPGS